MKTFAALSLSAALIGGSAFVYSAPAAQAAPVGASLGVLEAGRPVVEEVAMRRRVVRRRGGNNAALAAGLIGAAVVGGAIIAESQRRDRAYERAYYYGNPGYAPGYYYGESDYYYAPPPKVYRQPGYYSTGYVDPYYGHRRYPRNPVRDPAGGGVMR